MPERITSRANSLCVHFRKLASSRSYRQETGEFLCDSPKLLHEALLWKAEIKAVLYTEGVTLPELDTAGVRAAEVSESVMRSVSPMETPQGVVFSCKTCQNALPEKISQGRCLVLDGIQDPGNVGTILRTADAFDCGGIFLLPGCADLYNPKTLRAAMGVHFRRALYPCTLNELTGLLGSVPMYAAALGENTVDVRQVDLTNAAIVIGSEGRGVSPEVLAVCQKTLKIPMSGRCESLNAAVAAAVLLWEGWRQKG